jgi:hypothetical protein
VGAYSIRIETDTDPSAISLKQQIPITPDQIYLLEVKVKKSNAAGYFDLVAFYTDGEEIEGDLALAVADTTTTAGAWEVLRYTFRAQPTAGKKFLNIVFGHQATAGHMLIDFFRLEPAGTSIRAHRASSAQSIANTTDTTIVFNTVGHDDGDEFDTATGLFTASAAGDYSVSACATAGLLSGNDFLQVRLIINSTLSRRGQYVTAGGTNRTIQTVLAASVVRLEAGDTLGVSLYRSSSAVVTITAGDNNTYVLIKRVGE